MRVTVLGTRGFPGVAGGMESHCEGLYPALSRLGCRVEVLARKRWFPGGSRIGSYEGVSLRYLPAPRRSGLEVLGHTLLGILQAAVSRPDVLHIHGVGPGLLVPFARLLGLKVVFTHHGADYRRRRWGGFARLALRLGERLGAGFANRVIAVSDETEAAVRRFRRQGLDKIPNGVARDSRSTSSGYLESLGLSSKHYMIAVGRFDEDKGFHDLIAAFAESALGDMRLVVVGGTHHQTPYSRALQSSAAQQGVLLPGMLTGPALKELLSHARLFVLPSYQEGMSIALLEAMNLGIDVLASDIPANKALGLEGTDYFPVGNVAALGLALRAKVAGPAERDFTAILDDEHRWSSIAVRTLSVYRDVIGESRAT